jgi:hypothetical protein
VLKPCHVVGSAPIKANDAHRGCAAEVRANSSRGATLSAGLRRSERAVHRIGQNVGAQLKRRRQTSVTAVSVWRRVDRDQAMMKSDRNFIRRKCLVLTPIADVA